MKLVIATPLYPPDIAEPAPYVKELVGRLSGMHEITVVLYGHLPEAVPGVRTIAISKQRPLLLRLFSYTRALLRATKDADVLYVENGASVELPARIVTFLRPIRVIVHLGDARAHERAGSRGLRAGLEHSLVQRAETVLEEAPLPRPEILPFSPYPTAALATYEVWWKSHLTKVSEALQS